MVVYFVAMCNTRKSYHFLYNTLTTTFNDADEPKKKFIVQAIF